MFTLGNTFGAAALRCPSSFLHTRETLLCSGYDNYWRNCVLATSLLGLRGLRAGSLNWSTRSDVHLGNAGSGPVLHGADVPLHERFSLFLIDDFAKFLLSTGLMCGSSRADRLSNMDGSGFDPNETVSRTLAKSISCTQRDAVPIRKVVVRRSFGNIEAPGSGADVCANSSPFARERVAFRHEGGMRLCRSGVPLVVPFPLRWPWVYGVSGTSPVRVFCSDSVSSPMGVIAWSVLRSSSEGNLF